MGVDFVLIHASSIEKQLALKQGQLLFNPVLMHGVDSLYKMHIFATLVQRSLRNLTLKN